MSLWQEFKVKYMGGEQTPAYSIAKIWDVYLKAYPGANPYMLLGQFKNDLADAFEEWNSSMGFPDDLNLKGIDPERLHGTQGQVTNQPLATPNPGGLGGGM